MSRKSRETAPTRGNEAAPKTPWRWPWSATLNLNYPIGKQYRQSRCCHSPQFHQPTKSSSNHCQGQFNNRNHWKCLKRWTLSSYCLGFHHRGSSVDRRGYWSRRVSFSVLRSHWCHCQERTMRFISRRWSSIMIPQTSIISSISLKV